MVVSTVDAKAAASSGPSKDSYQVPLRENVLLHVCLSQKNVLSWSSDLSMLATEVVDISGDVGDGRSHLSSGSPSYLTEGTCNLYAFPLCTTKEAPATKPSAEGLEMLSHILVWLAMHTNAMLRADDVGAYPMHALMVCNTVESLQVAIAIYEAVPDLLTAVHKVGLPYAGESALHVACANKAESTCIHLIGLAVRRLPRERAQALLRGQTEGAFFRGAPMRIYGGTTLSYACAFGLRGVIVALLETGLVSLNARADVCTLSGFLPIHVIVACSKPSIYEYVTCELRPALRATLQVTATGRMPFFRTFRNLTPLQLAARFGHHAVTQHILRKQCDRMWTWGPITQFALSLEGVDSSSTGGGDVMETIVQPDARPRATEMVLDSFMNGFLHQLFEQKWRLFGRRLHYVRLAILLCLLSSLTVQSFWLKADPSMLATLRPLSIMHMLLIVFMLEEELRALIVFTRNEQGAGDARLSLAQLARQGLRFFLQHNVQILAMSHACTVVGALLILIDGALPDVDCAPSVESWFKGTVTATLNGSACPGDETETFGRRLRSRTATSASHLEPEMFENFPISDEGAWAWLWLVQGLGLGLLFLYTALDITRPFESLHVLMMTMIQILTHDFLVFMAVFALVLAGFFTTLFIMFPRTGQNMMPHAKHFNEWHAALQAMVDLSFLAERIPFEILPDAFGVLSFSQSANFVIWLVIFYLFEIVAAVLMLNLLIAIFTDAFGAATSSATLVSRLAFATEMMKLELLARSLGMPTRVGELNGGKYVYIFRWLERGVTDGTTEIDTEGEDVADDEGIFTTNPFSTARPSQLSTLQEQIHRLEARMETAGFHQPETGRQKSATGIAPDPHRTLSLCDLGEHNHRSSPSQLLWHRLRVARAFTRPRVSAAD